MKKLTLFLKNLKTGFVAAAVLVAGVNANAQLSKWTFEGNANAAPTTYNATEVGSPTYAAGKVGNAIVLSGSGQYLTTPFVFNPGATPFTVNAWVKYTGAIDNTLNFSPVILQQVDGLGTGRGLLWLSSYSATASESLKFSSSIGGSASYGTTTAVANTWYMVSVTYASKSVNIYVNGVLDQTTTKTAETTQGGFVIGANKAMNGSYWTGAIDELAVYNSALTAAELLDLYNSSVYFRSSASGNWANASTWQSSADNSTWGNSTIVPTSSAIAVNVQTGHEVIVAANATASTLTVNAGGKLTLNSGFTLDALNLSLKSTATDGTATFKDLGGTLTLTNPATVEQYLTAGRNWYISSPVSAATGNVFAADATNPLYYYVENVPNDWTSKIANTSTALTVGTGYVANINSNRVVTFTGGTLNTGSQTISGLTSTGATFTGYNLVGNPYPSYLKWDNANRTNVASSIWYRSKSTGSWLWQTYNVNAPGAGTNGGTNLIPPMQAFWVKVTSGTGSISFVNNDRDHLDQSVTANRLKAPAEDIRKTLRLVVSNGINADETLIYADNNAQNGYDDYDSNKMFETDASIPEIYTVLGNEKLAINGFNSIADDQQLALGFKTKTANNFSIKASEVKNFANGTQIILKDALNPDVAFNLSEGSAYNFSAPITEANTNRFSLLFRAPGSTTGIENVNKLNAQVYVNAANQITIVAPEKSKYAIYNAVGQIVELGTVTNQVSLTTNHSKGVYVVRVSEKGKELTTRVIIK